MSTRTVSIKINSLRTFTGREMGEGGGFYDRRDAYLKSSKRLAFNRDNISRLYCRLSARGIINVRMYNYDLECETRLP